MDSLSRLTEALRCLPGIGPKSAQRMVYELLQHKRDRGLHLADCLKNSMEKIGHCADCNNFTEQTLCRLCLDSSRDNKVLCVVETPADLAAIEQSKAFQGNYFVLMGKISPLDGIGPNDIGLPKLKSFVSKNNVRELIIALSASIEGQATIHFIKDILKDQNIRISQLAHGIPSGGELEFLDGITISTAVRNRSDVS